MNRRLTVSSLCVLLIIGLWWATGCEKSPPSGPGNAQASTQDGSTPITDDPSSASTPVLVKKTDSPVKSKPENGKAASNSANTAKSDVKKKPPENETEKFEWREKKFPNGELSERVRVKQKPDGTFVSHGPITRWYENGDLYIDGAYAEGFMHGMWMSWYPGGQVRGKGEFKFGKKIGPWIRWHENGIKRLEYENVNGLKHGRWTYWDEDGNLAEEGEYANDRKHGQWIKYEKDGSVTETTWIDGEEQA
ncbi:MAG: toxin-antitoxin system YwqK family antitoxin [Phycisphaerales bacterium]|nr:toxin-antitoxin system YwqK family antitoxin [Phycisphaerales bacterium]